MNFLQLTTEVMKLQDYEDEFPLDPTQIKDSDNDGYWFDNTAGFNVR